MCGGKGYYCEHSTVETCWCVKPTPKADEVSELRAEVARLRTRLEISDKHPYDGIDCRDETIKGLERLIQGRWRPEVERLEAENAELRRLCVCAKQYDISQTLRTMIDSAVEERRHG